MTHSSISDPRQLKAAGIPSQVKEDWLEAGLLSIRGEQSSDGSGSYVVELRGEVDLSNGHLLESALRRAEESTATEILVDLSALSFMGSSELSILLAAQARAELDGRRLVFRRGAHQVDRLVELTQADRVLRFAA
jgi:anti-sigma B factor antagonist